MTKKCILIFKLSSRLSCQILTKLEFSRQIFEKILKYKIEWKSFQWELICSVRTDGQTDMAELIVVVRNFTKAPKNDGKASITW
jgi:hypothetical protein